MRRRSCFPAAPTGPSRPARGGCRTCGRPACCGLRQRTGSPWRPAGREGARCAGPRCRAGRHGGVRARRACARCGPARPGAACWCCVLVLQADSNSVASRLRCACSASPSRCCGFSACSSLPSTDVAQASAGFGAVRVVSAPAAVKRPGAARAAAWMRSVVSVGVASVAGSARAVEQAAPMARAARISCSKSRSLSGALAGDGWLVREVG